MMADYMCNPHYRNQGPATVKKAFRIGFNALYFINSFLHGTITLLTATLILSSEIETQIRKQNIHIFIYTCIYLCIKKNRNIHFIFVYYFYSDLGFRRKEKFCNLHLNCNFCSNIYLCSIKWVFISINILEIKCFQRVNEMT